MNKPSEKAAALAEELVGYVHPGMTRAAAVREVAEMIDDANEELLATISRVLADAQQCGAGACSVSIADLRKAVRSYQRLPLHDEHEHEDLFGRQTPAQPSLFAGGMP